MGILVWYYIIRLYSLIMIYLKYLYHIRIHTLMIVTYCMV